MLDSKRRGILVAGVIEDSQRIERFRSRRRMLTRYDGHPVHATIPEDLPPLQSIGLWDDPRQTLKVVGLRAERKWFGH